MWKLENGMISRVRKHFDNRGGEGEHTKYYENLSDPIKKEIEDLTGINSKVEIPIIASYLKNKYLFLLTDSKLYWLENGGDIKNINLEEVVSANVDLKMRNDANNMFKGLKLTTKSNEVFSVEIEPGKPLSGIQNVILLIPGLNKVKS